MTDRQIADELWAAFKHWEGERKYALRLIVKYLRAPELKMSGYLPNHLKCCNVKGRGGLHTSTRPDQQDGALPDDEDTTPNSN